VKQRDANTFSKMGVSKLQKYPFVSAKAAMAIARVMTALFFMAHAGVRIANGSIPQFGKFMESVGFPIGEAWVWAITITELVCGALLIANRHVRLATIPLAVIAFTGIGLIHVRFGWFVGEHGTGGMEYSVALLVLLLLVAANASEKPR
jgi:putative oxidoreductase